MTCKWCSDVRYWLDQTYYPPKRPNSEFQPTWVELETKPTSGGEGDLWEE